MNKSLGLQRGRSDMVLYYGGRGYMIEVKSDLGLLGESQVKWSKLMMKHGFAYYVVRNLVEFQNVINGIVQA